MFKKLVPIWILTAGLIIPSAHAQLAKQKDIKPEEVMAQLLPLLQADDAETNATLARELLALEQSENEQFVILSVWLYKQLNQQEKAEEAESQLVKRFPKGTTARSDAYEAIFSDEEQPVARLEKTYRRWLKKFPAGSYTEKQQDIYRRAQAKMAIRYYSAGDYQRAEAYVREIKDSGEFPYYAHAIGSYLIKAEKYDVALPILETGITQAQASLEGQEDAKQKSVSMKHYTSLAPQYAKVLLETSASEKALGVLKGFLEEVPRASRRPDIISMLARGYTEQGLELEAFLTLNTFLIENGVNQDMLEQIQPLYLKLNSNKEGFQDYLTQVKLKAKAALVERYKASMIKKEAPLFSLLNREGQIVELADLKGKVVVLDFWATWCGPCKISFPGMQAAVNKYKDDPEVEFLFIDTWQREDNYKELVDKFIMDNNYTFHVLFDEMKDQEKATTTSYGVRGIPHKVVIDKQGYIRFESSGASADIDKLVGELETMIELARKG